MGKSATVIGREFGRNAREMNALLRDYDYLEGSPGAYGPTEKGQQYAEWQHRDNGYGGHAERNWEWLTWGDALSAALRADMEAHPGGIEAQEPPREEAALEEDPPHVYGSGAGLQDADDRRLGLKEMAIAGAVLGVIVLVAPHAKSLWDNKVKPAAQRVRAKFANRTSAGAQSSEIEEAQE